MKNSKEAWDILDWHIKAIDSDDVEELRTAVNLLIQEAEQRGANQVLQSLKATFEEEKAIFVKEAEERGEERGFNAARESVPVTANPLLSTSVKAKYSSLADFKAAKGKEK